MAPEARRVAAALDGPWDVESLTARLAGIRGWRGPAEIGDGVAALLLRFPDGPPAGDPEAEPTGALPGEPTGALPGEPTGALPGEPTGELIAEVAAVLTGMARRPIRPEPPTPNWRWPVRPWDTVEALAADLDLRDGELDWFADPRGWLRRQSSRRPDGPLRHYRARWFTARSGSVRLLETPGPRLAELQRRVGRHVLRAIPVHPAAHGYRPGRSVHTFAAAHAGRRMVVRLDVEGFFSQVSGVRVAGLLRGAGYPPGVAAALAGLLVTATPFDVLRAAPSPDGGQIEARRRLLDRLAGPHLPQGAPTSPAVANLLAFRLDRRLAGLADALGAVYGRYADDLVFSADRLPVGGLIEQVVEIAAAEGLRVRTDKTRVLPAHHRQRITGLVVNAVDTPAAPDRADYDALRALLHNCARYGPDTQNRHEHPAFRDHLLGRIAWVGSGRPSRAARLRALFDAIDWSGCAEHP